MIGIKKIGWKLIFVVGVTAIIIIAVYSYVNLRSQQDSLLAEVERHANQLSETIKNSTRYDMLLNQRERIHKIISDIGSDPAIREVRILNKEGVIIYSSQEKNIGRMVDKNAESCYACHAVDKPFKRLSITERTRIFRTHSDSARILGIINPIYNEQSCWIAECHAHNQEQSVLGVLDVATSLADVDVQIEISQIETAIFAISAIVAISAIIGFFLRRWVDAPVSVLVKATHEIGAGNLSYRIEETRDDDLGMLARSFNRMTEKLSEARLQLFQSDKMASLGRLAAGVAHEINNPLTGVLTYSSHLLKKFQNTPDLHEDLGIIVRETIRSREIVKSLLDFARQSVPKKHQADMNEIVRRSVNVVENQLAIKKISLKLDLNNNLPSITVDTNQMEQVIINLIVNAVDAIGINGGIINIKTSRLHLSPQGVIQIRKAICSKGHSLIDPEYKIDGVPALRVKARKNGSQGFLVLDPVYGRSHHLYEIQQEEKGEYILSCVRCDTSLMQAHRRCPVCNAATFALDIPGQGTFEACARKGCVWQRWETIDVDGPSEYIEVKVSDTGIGIPREDINRIFEPFFTTKGQRGTGLGLAVVWGIVDNHNGTIHVESEVGKGTIFSICLPANQYRRS